MEVEILQKLYASHPQIKAGISVINKTKNIFLKGLNGSSSSLLVSSFFQQTGKTALCVMNDLEEAGYLYHDLCQTLGDANILFFPSAYKREIRYGQRDAANDILRMETLARLNKSKKPCIVVSYPEALVEKVVSADSLKENTLKISVAEKIDSSFVSEVLDSYGFEYVDYVYEPGQYAQRGSIIDVFSYSYELPYRIDFFGDEVESIRSFEVESQLSKEKLSQIDIVSTQGEVAEATIFSYLNSESLVFLKNEEWVYEKADATWNENLKLTNQETFQSLEQIRLLIVEAGHIEKEIAKHQKIHLTKPKTTNENDIAVIEFETQVQPPFHKNFELVTQTFQSLIKEGYHIYILSDNEKQIARIRSIFEDRGDKIDFTPIPRALHEGFIDVNLKACLFTDHQLFDRFHKYNLKSEKARSGKIVLSLKELQQFQQGDFVVHIDHGVGKFGGLIRADINGKMQEVIKMTFLNEDTIFVSIHSLHKISKYKGKDGEPPRLNKIGSPAWSNLKSKTKKKVKDIAKDLILLYSKRLEEKGFAFSPDTYLQKELEASFIYEDTPDQEKTTNDIKIDMENSRPMDRLVCGDVGFGKTEVAIRAAFKAVGDSKQVAVLVPTTLLAYQHYKTFTKRLKDFPCNVEYLSRARKASEVKEIIQNTKDGKVDILIGTHRLVSKDIVFKDLGLLVIDEEQKFGVSVKEKLKQMKLNVDTLTLTATPIPRTLQFSLMGARDLSSINTPPPNRHPIQTEVHRFSGDIIREAIGFELSRNGQVFILNNKVQTLQELEKLVKKEVPDARIAIGHGQMDSHKLEEIISDFANHEYDVLIATTIIENGIDIPNANTIIINNAHHFGLSELHQVRGRVGRSNRKAFCYLLAPPLPSLSTEGRRRLQAIENFSELGSGIHIAMQDLDIRGAGNMLGAEQSGFIADLGYETYQKILNEAMQELRNEEFSELYKNEDQIDTGTDYVLETLIESDMELLFPSTYIPNDSERISIYRELDNLEKDLDILKFTQKLEDRFGKIPPQGKELIRVVKLKRNAKILGIEKAVLKMGKMNLYLVKDPQSTYYESEAFGKLLKYMQENYKKCQLSEKNNRRSIVFQQVANVETANAILESITS